MSTRWLLPLALATGAAAAQDKPGEYAYFAPVGIDAAASHYRFSLPAAAYRGAARPNLADLRVFNASGEPVPYAFAPREPRPAAREVRTLNLFPLHGDLDKGLDATQVRVERTSRGSVVKVSVANGVPAARRKLIGYLVDASELKAPKDALILSWEARQGFSGEARVEGSEELKYWQTLVSNAPILFLHHSGARLERNRVELGGARAKYLRVSFQGVPPDFALKEVRVELRGDKPEPVREWLSVAAKPGKSPGELTVDTGGHFPVDRLRLTLPQPNTVAQIRLLTRERTEEAWHAAASATAYRLARDGGDLTNPDIAVYANASRYWLIQVDQKGGGFGAGEVRLALGWLPDEVVFAARGAGPFTLAYGNTQAKPGALPISAVLPGDVQGLSAARVVPLGEVTGTAPTPPSLLRDPARFLRGLSENREAKKWTLWSALLAGVLLLAWMAFRLLRELRKSAGRDEKV